MDWSSALSSKSAPPQAAQLTSLNRYEPIFRMAQCEGLRFGELGYNLSDSRCQASRETHRHTKKAGLQHCWECFLLGGRIRRPAVGPDFLCFLNHPAPDRLCGTMSPGAGAGVPLFQQLKQWWLSQAFDEFSVQRVPLPLHKLSKELKALNLKPLIHKDQS